MRQITCIFQLSVDPTRLEDFKALITDIVENTSREAGAVIYEYSINAADPSEVHIIERYQADAVLPHITQTFAPYADRFLALAQIRKLCVYGDATTELRNTLDSFGAVYLTPLAGFSV